MVEIIATPTDNHSGSGQDQAICGDDTEVLCSEHCSDRKIALRQSTFIDHVKNFCLRKEKVRPNQLKNLKIIQPKQQLFGDQAQIDQEATDLDEPYEFTFLYVLMT
jgi:hypothetical protein